LCEHRVEAVREAAECRLGHRIEELAREVDVVFLERLRRSLAVLRECDERGAAVGWVRFARDEVILCQSIDEARDGCS
jgi:hypothetical protein